MLTWFVAGLLIGCLVGAGLTVTCLSLAWAAKKGDRDARTILRRTAELSGSTPQGVRRKTPEHVAG